MDDSDPRRDALHDFLQQQGLADIERPAVLTGWVMVAEWMDDTGDRWLSRAWSASKAKWDADGMLHEAIYGDWPEDQVSRYRRATVPRVSDLILMHIRVTPEQHAKLERVAKDKDRSVAWVIRGLIDRLEAK